MSKQKEMVQVSSKQWHTLQLDTGTKCTLKINEVSYEENKNKKI